MPKEMWQQMTRIDRINFLALLPVLLVGLTLTIAYDWCTSRKHNHDPEP